MSHCLQDWPSGVSWIWERVRGIGGCRSHLASHLWKAAALIPGETQADLETALWCLLPRLRTCGTVPAAASTLQPGTLLGEWLMGSRRKKSTSDTLLHIGSQAPDEKNPAFNYFAPWIPLLLKKNTNSSKRNKPCKASEPNKSLDLCCCIIHCTWKEHVFLLFVVLLEKNQTK